MTDITIPTLDGHTFGAQLSLPGDDHGPGLILVRGLFSTSERMAYLGEMYAKQGFVVVAPEIFHRQGDATACCADDTPDWDRANSLYKNFDVEAGVRDMLATLAFLRAYPVCAGSKIGVVGYCLGCRLAYLLAARSDIDACVGFYGVGLENMLDEAADIRAPSLFHFAEADKLLPPSARQKIIRAIMRNPVITHHTYPGAEHGFARETAPTYHPDQAALATQRTIDFLSQHLKA